MKRVSARRAAWAVGVPPPVLCGKCRQALLRKGSWLRRHFRDTSAPWARMCLLPVSARLWSPLTFFIRDSMSRRTGSSATSSDIMTPRCIILPPTGSCSWQCLFSSVKGMRGIQPHWGLFCRCFEVLPQSGRKVAGSLWIKAADKSSFFHIDLPSNVPNWAKK